MRGCRGHDAGGFPIAPGRRGDGQQVGLGDDAARRRGPDRAGRPVESKVVSAHRTPRAALPVCGERPRAGAWRSSIAGAGGAAAPAGNAGGDLDPAGAGRAGREQGAAGGRFAAVDRADAAGRAGRDAGHRHLGGGQRGAAGRGDPGAEVPGDPRRPWRASARRRPRPWGSRRNEQPGAARVRPSIRPSTGGLVRFSSAGVAGRHRQRPARPDVRPGRAADGLSRRRAERDRGHTRRPGRPLDGDRPCRPPSGAPAVRRRRPRRSPSSSRTSRPRPCAGWPRRRVVRPGWRTVWISQNRLREKTLPGRHGIPHAPWRPVRTEAELDAAVHDARTAPDPQDGQLGLRRQGAGAGHAGGRGGRRLGQPGPGRLRGRGLGRVRGRGLGRRRPRARRQRGLLPGRPEPPRAAHPRHDGDAGAGRARSSRRRPATWPWPWPRRWGPSACSASSSS